MKKKYKFFSHKECDFFPCHRVENIDDFNCLFCYCPLYSLGSRCGGNFSYNEKDIKDCSNCNLPHKKENYNYIIGKFAEISEIAKKNR